MTPPSLRPWALAIVGATVMAAIVAAQNTFALPRGWWELFLFELPVWYAWVLLSPAIVQVSRHFSIVEGRRLVALAVHVAMAALSIVAAVTLTHLLRRVMAPASMLPFEQGIVFTIPRVFGFFVIVYFAIVSLEHWLGYHRAFTARAVQEAELRGLLARSQLETLRLQLQPHFLFNTMNTISSLMGRDVATARLMMADLGELLRATLRHPERHEVTLEEEVSFLETYLRIQKARFEHQLDVVLDLEDGTLLCLVPRMLLQPLVENAIVHGTRGGTHQTRVCVRARLDEEQERLSISISDDRPGLDSADPPTDGVGLANARRRLEQLHGTAQSLTLTEAPGGGAVVTVKLPVACA